MGTPQHRMGAFTEEQLQSLADRDDTVVMQHTWDRQYDPWKSSEMTTVVANLCSFCLQQYGAGHDADQVRRLARQQVTGADSLAKTHKKVFEVITTHAVLTNPDQMKVVHYMLGANETLQSGAVSEEQAKMGVAAFAMASLAKQAKERGGCPAGEHSAVTTTQQSAACKDQLDNLASGSSEGDGGRQ